jgi:hydrogenase nickel incorporation protein HypA/HybF
MHEVSIAQEIISIVTRKLGEAGYRRARTVSLQIGSASGVFTDSLLFAFDAMKPGTPLEDAAILVEEIPLGGVCAGCSREFSVCEKYITSCPHCGSPEFRLLRGNELDIKEIDAF